MQGLTPGETVAAASHGYRELADYLAAHAAEDCFILGRAEVPKPQSHLEPVVKGTEEQRKGRVDAWARARGVAAFWHEETGTYRAVKMFGAVSLVVYMMPDPLPAPAVREDAGEMAVA
jgi:hypothetical protein